MIAYSESNAFRNPIPTFDCAISCTNGDVALQRYLTVRIAASRVPSAGTLDEPFCVKPKGSPDCSSGSSCRDKQGCRETGKHAESTALVLGQQTASTTQSQTSGSGTWMQEETVALLSRPILGTTVARWADLFRWADPQDMSRQVDLVDGACSGSGHVSCHGLQFYARRGSTRTNHFSPEKNYRNSSSSSGASQSWLDRHELLASLRAAAVCEHRFSPVFCILEKTCEPAVTHAILVKDVFFQPRSLLRQFVTADNLSSGTWLQRKDWLALR